MGSQLLVELESDKFDSVTGKRGRMVLVAFWAEWCGYCHVMDPIVQDAAAKYQDKIEVFRMNADDNLEIANQLRISRIQALSFFSNRKARKICRIIAKISAVPEYTP